MTLPTVKPEDIHEEMEVLLHLGASCVRNLIAAVKGDDLGADCFTKEELTTISLTLGEKFLDDYEAFTWWLERERQRE